MACGAAVVTTEETVMAEVADDAARLVPVGDVAALASSLLEILHLSEAQRARDGARSRARAELFTWDECVDRHLEAYDLAVGG
jgi:glycosyltransferase involved in cell wall biosynthesis